MKKQLENLEILRDGIPENFEYMERMRENTNDFDDLELNVTYEMDRNLNNKSIEVFLEKKQANLLHHNRPYFKRTRRSCLQKIHFARHQRMLQ